MKYARLCRIALIATLASMASGSAGSSAESQADNESPYQKTFESCALMAYSAFQFLNGYLAGVQFDALIEDSPYPENAKRAYRMVQVVGIESVYMDAHSRYLACALGVYERTRVASLPLSELEQLYSACGLANSARFAVLLDSLSGDSIDEDLETFPPLYHEGMMALAEVLRGGTQLEGLTMSADAHHQCLKAVSQRTAE